MIKLIFSDIDSFRLKILQNGLDKIIKRWYHSTVIGTKYM